MAAMARSTPGAALASGGGGGGLGGAIFVFGGTTTITNSTFSGNAASGGISPIGAGASVGQPGGAGGAAVFVHAGTAAVDSTTIADNTGTSSLEVYTGGTLRVSNTLVIAGANAPCRVAGSGAFASLNGNLVQGVGATCTFTTGDKVNPTPPSAPAALADNGGPTPTRAIGKTDPAFRAASCAVGTDQRGLPRPERSSCDVGAFELAERVDVAVTGNGRVTSVPGSIACPGACNDVFKPGTAVSLTAAPVAPATFLGWSGDIGAGAPTSNPLGLVVDVAPLSIGARFDGAADAGVDASDASDAGDAGAEAGAAPPDPHAKPTVSGGATACKSVADCGGKPCVEGVCCDRACDGVCESCRVPSAPGVCTLIPFGSDSKGACTSGTTCVKTCDGAGHCIDAQQGVQCAPSACLDHSTARGIGVCASQGGTCEASTATFDCAPYACDALFGGCKTVCATTDDCAAGHSCDVTSKLCVASPSVADGGCGVGGGLVDGRAWWALATLMAAGAAKRWRRRA